MSSGIELDEPEVQEPIVRPRRKPRHRTNKRPKKQPPYAVIIENDDFHTFIYVIEVLQKVFGYGLEKAFPFTRTIHTTGRAVVWSGTLEVAELKRDQIRSYGPDDYAPRPVRFPLGVTIEPLPMS